MHGDYAVDPAVDDLIDLGVRKIADQDGIESVAGGIAEPAEFAAEFESDGFGGPAVMLDINPHVFVIGFLHGQALLKSRLFRPEVRPGG